MSKRRPVEFRSRLRPTASLLMSPFRNKLAVDVSKAVEASTPFHQANRHVWQTASVDPGAG